MSRTQTLIEMILRATPYLPCSAKYQMMAKDLAKLSWDTLLIIRQSQKPSAMTDNEASMLSQGGSK